MALLLCLPLHPPPLCWDYRYIWLCLALSFFDVSTRTFKFRRSCFCSKQSYPLNYLSSPTLKFLFHDVGSTIYFWPCINNLASVFLPPLPPFFFLSLTWSLENLGCSWISGLRWSLGLKVLKWRICMNVCLQECMCAICVLSAYEGWGKALNPWNWSYL